MEKVKHLEIKLLPYRSKNNGQIMVAEDSDGRIEGVRIKNADADLVSLDIMIIMNDQEIMKHLRSEYKRLKEENERLRLEINNKTEE